MSNYDVVIVGSGPGGYIAAEEAAKLGNKVAVVEKQAIGGTCLNVGCMPSKSYLQHAHWLLAIEAANKYGIKTTIEQINFKKLWQRKNKVVKKLQAGIHSIFTSNAIDYIEGEATVTSDGKISVNGKTLGAKDIILATGSRPFVPPIKGLETADYLTTDSFFALEELPDALVIIGGGVIAVELAFAMKPLGVDVTLIEVAPDILMTEDPDARALIKQKLKKMGIAIETAADIKDVTKHDVKTAEKTYTYDELLVATGRQPNLALADTLGLERDDSGKFVKVNERYQTSVPNVYAIGDLIGGYQLAHAASAEGICAVQAINKQAKLPVNPNVVPRCVYTEPEVASFGLNAEEGKAAGYDVLEHKLPFSINGKAIAQEATEGFIKLICERNYGQIIGGVLVGSGATDMVHQLLAIVACEGTVDQLDQMVFAHPTMSELLGEVVKGIKSQL